MMAWTIRTKRTPRRSYIARSDVGVSRAATDLREEAAPPIKKSVITPDWGCENRENIVPANHLTISKNYFGGDEGLT